MKEVMQLAKQTLETLVKQAGSVKAQCYLERTKRTEFRFSLTEPYMLRTVLEESAELVTMDEQHRVGRISVPSIEKTVLNTTCADCVAFMHEAEKEPDCDLVGVINNGIYTAGDLVCDPKKRYRTAEEMLHALNGQTEDEYVEKTELLKFDSSNL